VFATVTREDDVTRLQSDAGVPAGAQVGVTAVAGEPHESAREFDAVALGDPPCPPDVPAGALLAALGRRLAGEFVQPLDALRGEAHTGGTSRLVV